MWVVSSICEAEDKQRGKKHYWDIKCVMLRPSTLKMSTPLLHSVAMKSEVELFNVKAEVS